MIILAAVAILAVPVVVLLLTRSFETERIGWANERRELLTRIQHPQIIPASPTTAFEPPDPEPDDWHMVGTVGDTIEDTE